VHQPRIFRWITLIPTLKAQINATHKNKKLGILLSFAAFVFRLGQIPAALDLELGNHDTQGFVSLFLENVIKLGFKEVVMT
jgi:hypothetical protein